MTPAATTSSTTTTAWKPRAAPHVHVLILFQQIGDTEVDQTSRCNEWVDEGEHQYK
jgi:hypothetical protein